MEFQISGTLKKMMLEQMIENNLTTYTEFGIVLSTEKKLGSLPTGYCLRSGEEIYIQP